ncbi:MAG: Hpt domain-containing protein [Gammaproteobacteria bacterium]|nr:Hpt domain-containing protein [Gammaproteobacteria bacterium]
MNIEPEIYDSKVAIKQAGGDTALAEELFGMLVGELPEYLHKIGALSKERDYNQLQETVHKLNGATRYTGVPALSTAANQFELALRNDTTGSYDELSSNLIQEIQRLKDAYPQD